MKLINKAKRVSLVVVSLLAALLLQPLVALPAAAYDIGRGPNESSRAVLTYDDCPKSLKDFKRTVKAAKKLNIGLVLFPTGNCIKSGRFDVAYARKNGHWVFNHSVSHPDLRKLSYSLVLKELGKPGVRSSFGRPPYGAYNSTVKKAYKAKKMKIWMWTVDTNDWRGKSRQSVVSHVINNTRKGDTVLMHMQWNGFSATAIKQMKAGLKKKGVKLCRNYDGKTPLRPKKLTC